MTKFISRYKAMLAGMLLLILSAYYVNSSMFYHQHIVNGHKVTHSHFFSKVHTSSSEDGGHSLEVIKLIGILNDIALEEQHFESLIALIEPPLDYIRAEGETSAAIFFVEPCRSLRAPPIV